jgi:hypothetical protein
MAFFLETLFGGLMTGMLYSLVALGFVLIFKASGAGWASTARFWPISWRLSSLPFSCG